jgi:hydrogenase 3 maturation protease
MEIGEKYKDLLLSLKKLLEKTPKLLILGIGENRMGDDGIGPMISFNLSLKYDNPQILIMNGGIIPEERLDEIIAFQPEVVIIIDAIDIDKPKGTASLLDESRMLNYLPISSHSMPLPIFVDRIKSNIPNVSIKLLGLVPFSMQFKKEYELFKEDVYSLDEKDENINIPFYAFNLSKEMEKTGSEVEDLLIGIFDEIYKK